MLILWIVACFLVLRSEQRSLGWLVLAVGGPIGFAGIAILKDLAPASGDLYQRFIGKLKIGWRVPLELVVFVVIWILAF